MISQIDRIWADLLRHRYHGWAGAEMRAISAIDIALWDLAGRPPISPSINSSARPRASRPVYNTCYDHIDFNTDLAVNCSLASEQ